MAILIVTASEKGGVAKTTTTLNLLTALSLLKLRVLGLDCDPQGGLTFSFGINRGNLEASLYEVIRARARELADKQKEKGEVRWSIRDIIVRTCFDDQTRRFLDPTERVDPDDPSSPTVVDTLKFQNVNIVDGPHLAPISRAAADADKEIILDDLNWVYSLREALAPVWNEYDYIIADTNPSAGCLTRLCLCTTPHFFVPMIPDQLSVQGLFGLLRTARQAKKNQNKGLELTGMLFTKVSGYRAYGDTMAKLKSELASELKQAYPEFEFPFFETVIQQLKDGVESAEALSAAVIYRPDSMHAISYWCFLKELMDAVGGPAKPLLPKVLRAFQQALEKKAQQAEQKKEERAAVSES